jgi:tRNA (guanine-N(7)-)-methyltransferase
MTRILKDYPEISLKPENLDGKIDFARLFGRPGPIHIEIGSGKGTFLVSQAKAQPDDNFLGIEWAGRYYRYAVDRIGRWDMANVRIIRTDAAVFLAESVPDDSVDYFHIYFPDPWHKKRHNKRRLICPANLENFIRCLKTGGQLRLATDHADYFRADEDGSGRTRRATGGNRFYQARRRPGGRIRRHKFRTKIHQGPKTDLYYRRQENMNRLYGESS